MSRFKRYAAMAAVVWLYAGSAGAESFRITMRDQRFVPDTLQVAVGDTLVFHNQDDHVHNPYSLSKARMFDLGLMGRGAIQSVPVTLPGRIDVRCALEPTMQLQVEVS